MANLLQRYRNFRHEHLLFQYFTLAFTRWQAVLWGPSVLAVVWGMHFTVGIATPPVWLNWTAVVVALFVAGYCTWRADHVRLIAKLAVRGTHFQETPITRDGIIYDHRTFVQLVPTCLTEAPVYESVAYLQRVEKLNSDDQWEETALDRNLILNWAREHHPQSEQMLNVFFIQHQTNQIIPCLPAGADIPWEKFDAIFRGDPGVEEFRFHIQITYSDKANGDSLKPVRVRLDVKFDNDPFHPSLEVIDMDAQPKTATGA
jgi:hypothetical protein